MKNKHPKIKTLLLFICIALTLPGCGQTSKQQDANHIQVALVCRDGMQYDASRFRKGMEMAMGEYAGGYDVTVTLYDDSTEFEEALEIDTRLAQDPNITAVVTLQDYEEIDVAARLMDANGKAYFAVEGYLDQTADKNYNTFFPFCIDAANLGRAMGVFAGEQGYENVAVFHSGTPFELAQANYFERALIEYGASTVISLSEPASAQEISTLTGAIDTLDVDAVYLPYYRSSWAMDILSDIKAQHPEVAILANFTLGSAETVEMLEAAEGVIGPAYYPVERGGSGYAGWESRYMALYGETPENQAVQGYDIITLIINNYDGDNARLAENIRKNAENASGIAGPVVNGLLTGLSDAGSNIYKYLVIRNGKFVPVQYDAGLSPA